MIEIKNLSKKFGETNVLNDISFSVKKGEILGFLGPNGAGKSTTMKIITDFWSPSAGSVEIDGVKVSEDSLKTKKMIGYLPETVPLYDDMLVVEYLKFVAEARGLSKDKKNSRIKEVVESCNLREVLRKPIDELSKGYRQRVGLAQAIMHEPDILILDEPTTGLDPKQIIEIRNLIKEIGKEKTIIFSTHILSEVSATCDRVVIISKGSIVGEGTPDEILNNTEAKRSKSIQVKIDGDQNSVIEKIKGIEGVVSVEVKDETTLEDAFLELTK